MGARSASDESINAELEVATKAGIGVTWIQDANDAEVNELVAGARAFLSIGTEGYGIPVLEAIALGTPVFYDGIQPAGELMEGRGARRVLSLSHDNLVSLFTTYSQSNALEPDAALVQETSIPTWSEFAHMVAISTT